MGLFDSNSPPFGPPSYDFNRPTNVDMAGEYSATKSGLGKIYKENAIATGWQDEEPLITPQKLKSIHLWGIPLVSNIRNPLTQRPDIMGDPELKEFITEAVSIGQAEAKIDIFPTQYCDKAAFDRAAYDNFGYFQLRHRPVASLESICVTPSNEMPLLRIPLYWVETGLLHQGQVNLIPLTIATRGNGVVPLGTSPFGATWLSILGGNKPWVPAMFEFVYTAGFPEGCVPKIINQYIGCIAAMEVLSVLATTYSRSTSTSLGIDGLSQGISSPGQEIFTQRMKELGEKRHWMLGRIQASVGMGIVFDNV